VPDHEWYCAGAEAEIALMASAVSGADLSGTVPTCPGWTIERLVAHIGVVHRWATQIVATRATAPVDHRDLDMGFPDEGSGWAAWLAAGAAPLTAALRSAGPDAAVWTWGPAGRSGWWARRMLHETTVHRADAETALGAVPAVDPAVAADGIDEFLSNLPFARRPREHLGSLPAGESLHLHATDSDGEWLIRFSGPGPGPGPDGGPSGGIEWSRGHAKATAAVRGPVSVLLLFTYGRVPGSDPRLTVFGEQSLLDAWQQKTAL
jgi:uncharacterized protein (TIGR03083 family)